MKTKTFFISSCNSVFIADYKDGDGDMVSEYNIKAKISADSAESALMLFIEKQLYFNFCKENINIDDTCGIVYSALVDDENYEASKEEIKKWQKGALRLYSHYSNIKIHELVEVDTLKIAL
jgi:hypothetical protein